jgi:hypothetical protein
VVAEGNLKKKIYSQKGFKQLAMIELCFLPSVIRLRMPDAQRIAFTLSGLDTFYSAS